MQTEDVSFLAIGANGALIYIDHCFFADASLGVREAEQFLTHMCGALIVRYKLNPRRIDTDAITAGPSMIASEGGALRSVVFLNVRGRDIGSVVREAQEAISQEVKLPSGYWITWWPSGTRASVVRRPRSVSPNTRYTEPRPPGSGPRSIGFAALRQSFGAIRSPPARSRSRAR